MEGIIIKLISNDYTVLCNGKKYICKARGKFRNLNVSPLVGDRVIIDPVNNYILEVKKRKNYLNRPSVANIDQAVIITSLKSPDFSSNLLDKLLVTIISSNIKPIICFTKLDLANMDDFKDIANYYKKIGIEVYFNNDIESIKKIFKDKISVFTGQSGAGKSTLLNKLDSSLNLKTGGISKALNRGKHTTRHVELLELCGGYIADTPGFSALDLNNLGVEEIKNAFLEFRGVNCKYKDCNHYKEDECEVKEKLAHGEIMQSRYDNYIKFITGGDRI